MTQSHQSDKTQQKDMICHKSINDEHRLGQAEVLLMRIDQIGRVYMIAKNQTNSVAHKYTDWVNFSFACSQTGQY